MSNPTTIEHIPVITTAKFNVNFLQFTNFFVGCSLKNNTNNSNTTENIRQTMIDFSIQEYFKDTLSKIEGIDVKTNKMESS